MTTLAKYKLICAQGEAKHDPAQAEIINILDKFALNIISRQNFIKRLTNTANYQAGIYLWGLPGGGKTWIIKLFCEHLRDNNLKPLILHQQEFNLDIQKQLHKLSSKHKDPVHKIIEIWKTKYDLIFLDDIHLTDIVGVTLFQQLWHHSQINNIPWLISSNRPPENLYRGGVARNRFLKTIRKINNDMTILNLATHDYRRQLAELSRLHITNTMTSNDNVNMIFAKITNSKPKNSIIAINQHNIPIIAEHKNTLCIDFLKLCSPPRNQADYFKICDKYTTIIINNLHQIDERNHDLAISWIHCIDILYNNQVSLFINSTVPIDDIYPLGIYAEIHERTISRLNQMLAQPV